MIGQRLKVARAAAGLSLRALEAQIGARVTAQAISKYERNESMPSSGVLIALADALGVSVDYLVSDSEMVLDAVEFRKKKLTGKREEAQVEASVVHLLERYLTVEALLALPSVAWDKPRAVPYPIVRDVSEAEYAAHRLRTDWKLGSNPIPNMVELLEERGIKVLSFDLSSIDGLTARVRHGNQKLVPVIVVNTKSWGERQRFTLAHELGHIAMSVASPLDAEKAAHRFAGAFLIPSEALWTEVGKRRHSIGWRELFHLKRLFGVSVQVLAFRCRDLGIFNDALFQRLFRDFSRLGWCSPPYQEPLPWPGERPRRFERLCFRALSEGVISESKAGELLGITVHNLNRYMEQPPDPRAAGAP